MKENIQLTAVIAIACSTSLIISYTIPKLISYYKRRNTGRIKELSMLIQQAKSDVDKYIDLGSIPEDQLINLEATLRDVLCVLERTNRTPLLTSETEKYFTPPNDSDQMKDSEEIILFDGLAWKSLRDGYHNQQYLDEWKSLVDANYSRKFYIECADYYSMNSIKFRKDRTSFLGLSSIVDFMVKLHAVRLAFTIICEDQENVKLMLDSIKDIIILIFKVSRKPFATFEVKFDNMVSFCQDETNKEKILEELTERKLVDFSFYDIFLDFMIMDSLSDLDYIPQTMISVLQNRWLPRPLKENAFSNLVWSFIQTKIKFLHDNAGFIGKFYSICESVNPVFAWGLLGDQGILNEACVFIKETFIKYMKNIFNQNKVSYDSSNELASDILRGAKKMLNRIRVKLDSLL